MILSWYQHLPQYIDPVAFSIGSFPVRWYSISFIMAFVVSYLILFQVLKNSEFKKNAQIFNFQFSIFKKLYNVSWSNLVVDFLLTAFFGALIGGRVGYVLFYNLSYFISNPLSLISPYGGESLIGIYGMSYHGALVGVIVSGYVFAKVKKLDFLSLADFIAPAAALGYFFGRIGNFLNGELYGRITNLPIGMYFPLDTAKLRHPSQLYEALLEGMLLFIILWKLRNKKITKGSIFCFYLIGYGTLRILVERFREPDSQIGLLLGTFTMGQLLSLSMVVAGCWLYFFIRRNREM